MYFISVYGFVQNLFISTGLLICYPQNALPHCAYSYSDQNPIGLGQQIPILCAHI